MDFHCNRLKHCDIIALFRELSDHPSYFMEMSFLSNFGKGILVKALFGTYVLKASGLGDDVM